MQMSKMAKRVATVIGLGALSLVAGERAEAALPIQGVGQAMNVQVQVTGTCTLQTIPALGWVWDYTTPANNQDAQDLVIDCAGAPIPWELYSDGGSVSPGVPGTFGGAHRAVNGAEWLGYSLSASATSGTGGANVTLTAAADGSTSNGSATPSNGTYNDTVLLYIAY